jgi:hypothetical protein
MTETEKEPEISREQRILSAVKLTLTSVIKDTATTPGMKHPLSDRTIEDLRKCLFLISEREQELAQESGTPMAMRPRYIDEAQASPGVTEIPVSRITRKKPRS